MTDADLAYAQSIIPKAIRYNPKTGYVITEGGYGQRILKGQVVKQAIGFGDMGFGLVRTLGEGPFETEARKAEWLTPTYHFHGAQCLFDRTGFFESEPAGIERVSV